MSTQRGSEFHCRLAIAAIQGLCANPGGPFQANPMSGWGIVNCTVAQVAEQAWEIADAMIDAQEQHAKDHP